MLAMENITNLKIRYVQEKDKSFWFTLDGHLTFNEFTKKVRDKQGYILLLNNIPIGILRYNLFWDNTPFCNLLFINKNYRNKGYGKKLMTFWESEMQLLGYDWVLVSTQSDESAQNFYRLIGYKDCGSLILPDQPSELFLIKKLSSS